MKKLPIGYYFVGKAVGGVIEFRGEKFLADANRIYGDLSAAVDAANQTPSVILKSISYGYGDYLAPVILVGNGEHSHKRVTLSKDIYIFGDNAKLTGEFWYGFIVLEAKNSVLDGFIFENIRIEDHREEKGEYFHTSRNLVYTGTNPWWSHYCPIKSSDCKKYYTLENITVDGVDGLDYSFAFLNVSPYKLVVKNLKYVNTDKPLGFSVATPCIPDGGEAHYLFENCVFNDLNWQKGIYFDVSSGSGDFTLKNCKFDNVTKRCNYLFDLKLSLSARFTAENSSFNLKESVFIKGNADSERVTIKDCEIASAVNSVGERIFTLQDELKNYYASELYNLSDRHEETQGDFSFIEKYYGNRTPFYCDMHVHSNSGGTSDGLLTFEEWKKEMKQNHLDFVSICDHRQMRHFFLPDFDDTKFFYANEPEAILTDKDYKCPRLHYNMIFPDKYLLGKMLEKFKDKYEFCGDELTGSFVYKDFTHKELEEVAAFITENGGIFAHAHPKSMLTSSDPLDYYLGEKTYLEAFTDMYTSAVSQNNCKLWSDILSLGKKVYTISGSDSHAHSRNGCVSVVYAEQRLNSSLFPYFKKGDFSSGAFGIKASIGNTAMGGTVSYEDGLVFNAQIGDLFDIYENKNFLVKVITDKGIAYAKTFDGEGKMRISLAIKKRKFYRIEIVDLDNFCVFGLSNPIWINY